MENYVILLNNRRVFIYNRKMYCTFFFFLFVYNSITYYLFLLNALLQKKKNKFIIGY